MVHIPWWSYREILSANHQEQAPTPKPISQTKKKIKQQVIFKKQSTIKLVRTWRLTAALPQPRGPRSKTELLQASVTELDIINFNLLKKHKTHQV